MAAELITKSFIIPVLDFSPHSEYNILTLLDDLWQIEGEVICIFNSREIFEKLLDHKRINKFCYNSANAGVSRSWNIGIDMAEGRAVFVMNADLHVNADAIEQLESFLFNLDRAVVIGPQGAIIDFQNFRILRYFKKENFDKPAQTHDVSGFFFAIHRQRFLDNGLRFDCRFSPCFYEEWDMGLQVMLAGLRCYAVPVTDFEHNWGVSRAAEDPIINYFGRAMRRSDIKNGNKKKFIEKWFKNLGYKPPLPA